MRNKKKKLMYSITLISFILLLNIALATDIYLPRETDNFNGGTQLSWTTGYGTVTATGTAFAANGDSWASTPNNFQTNLDTNKFYWGGQLTNAATLLLSSGITPFGNYVTEPGYAIQLNATKVYLIRHNGSASFTQLGVSDAILTTGTSYNVQVDRNTDGNFSLYLDGTYLFSAVDTTYIDANYFVFFSGNATSYLDNFNSGQIVPSAAPSLTADFVYTLDKQKSTISFTDTSFDLNVVISDWNWLINGTKVSSDQNFVYSGTQNTDYNACLQVGGFNGIIWYLGQTCKTVNIDTFAPSVDGNISFTQGFGNNFATTITIHCTDPNSTTLTYKIVKNDTNTLLDVVNANNTTRTITPGLTINRNSFILSCTDSGLNTATLYLNTIYAILFRLVNENTGVVFDLNKVTAAQVFTYDGNFVYDFKDVNSVSNNFIGPSNTVRFDFTYPDTEATKISREINFDYIADENVGVCVAEYQQFYLYRFLSTSVKPIVVYNDFANCYNLASTTKFLYNTYQSNTAFTINKPYYLYTYSNGIKILLALLDGANNTEINLDILQFNQQEYVYSIETDQIIFVPSDIDLNTIVFYFTSPNNNDSVTLQIYNGDTLIWNYTELTDTNRFQVNFYYGDLNITDTNLLKIVVTVVNDGETNSFYKWFNTRAEAYAGILNPIVAIVMSFFVLFFGITMVSYRFAMGWFGLFVSFVAIGILAMAPMYDYIVFLMAIYFIIGIFIGVIGKEQTLGASN